MGRHGRQRRVPKQPVASAAPQRQRPMCNQMRQAPWVQLPPQAHLPWIRQVAPLRSNWLTGLAALPGACSQPGSAPRAGLRTTTANPRLAGSAVRRGRHRCPRSSSRTTSPKTTRRTRRRSGAMRPRKPRAACPRCRHNSRAAHNPCNLKSLPRRPPKWKKMAQSCPSSNWQR